MIENGVTIASICWYPSGEQESLKLDRNGIVQHFEWFQDGSIKKVSIYIREYREIIINVTLSEAYKLKSIRIAKNYFDLIMKYKFKLEHHYFQDKSSFENYSVSSTFSLINSGIDDLIFNSIALNNGLQDLSTIIISNTPLTESSILELANIQNLTQVILIEDKRDLLSIVKELKYKRPDCLVQLNHKIITNAPTS